MHDVSEEAKRCPTCGEAFVPFPGTEASDIITVEVRAYLRRIQRQCYREGVSARRSLGS